MELYEGPAGSSSLLSLMPPGRGASGGGGGGHAASGRLTAEEAVAVLFLRVDWAPEEVERAGQALRQLLLPSSAAVGGGMGQ